MKLTHVIVAALALALGGSARADILVATRTDDAITVQRIGADDKLTPVFSESGSGAYADAFSDASTLWILRKVGTVVTIGKVVNGKPAPTKPVMFADWKLKAEPELQPGMGDPDVLATTGGQIWLSKCLAIDPKAKGMKLVCKTGYIRVDDGSSTYSATAPKDLAARKPLAKPPTGYAVMLTKMKLDGAAFVGFTCTGPSGKKFAWPAAGDSHGDVQFFPRATKATWINAAPPVVHVDTNVTSPIGEKLHDDIYVVDCTTRITGDNITFAPAP